MRKRSFDEAAKTNSEQCAGQPVKEEKRFRRNRKKKKHLKEKKLRRTGKKEKPLKEERFRRNREKENEGEDERGERGCSCKVSLFDA